MSERACDWSCHSPAFLVGWGLPTASLALSGSLAPDWMRVIWPLAFLWMSVACGLNARRCGRLHCFFTGAFFLIMAILSALHGFNLVGLGGSAWSWMSITAIVGGLTLTFLPEMIWGRYRGGGAKSRHDESQPQGRLGGGSSS